MASGVSRIIARPLTKGPSASIVQHVSYLLFRAVEHRKRRQVRAGEVDAEKAGEGRREAAHIDGAEVVPLADARRHNDEARLQLGMRRGVAMHTAPGNLPDQGAGQ